MRHRKKGRKFGRVKKTRTALLRSLARSLILKEKIVTTEAKAKELRPEIERLVSKAKEGSLSSRRLLAGELDRRAVRKMVNEIAPRYQTRPGGYARIVKLPPRPSNGAKMAIIEFVK